MEDKIENRGVGEGEREGEFIFFIAFEKISFISFAIADMTLI